MPASQSVDSLSLSGLSISDVFARFTAALKTWFDHWLTLPVCLYFYMPQPISAQFIHAAMMLTRWAKIAGPDALKLTSAGTTTTSWKEVAIPAFSGIRACPDLNVPQPPASEASAPTVSAQTLNTLRAQVLAEPGLCVDVFGILDAMAVRFEAAKKEVTIAQGRVWENDTWDLAAKQIKIKKSKIEKWCQMVAAAAGEGRNRPTDTANAVDEGSGETMNMSGEQSIAGLEWVVSDNGRESMQWESDLFDGIMMDIDLGATFDTYGSWGTDILG